MGREEYSTIADQRKAAFKRLRDAERLLDRTDERDWAKQKGLHARGAMYLAGYAVECKLKAIAMEVNRCRSLKELQLKWNAADQEIYAHGLEVLAKRLPSIYNRFRNHQNAWRAFAGQVNRWKPSWRYDPEDHRNVSAAAFIDAVHLVYNWLESNR